MNGFRQVQITSGRGPIEVRVFVRELSEVLERWIILAGGRVRLDDDSGSDPVSVRLHYADVDLESWFGTHELLDPVRGRGRRRRWFCGVHERSLDRRLDIDAFDPRDVRMKTCRAGGPGGQHVNTTDSAVRAVHLPSGLSVRVTSERSQQRNRSEALRRLEEKWMDSLALSARAAEALDQKQHDGLIRGMPVARWRRRRGNLVSRE